MTTAGAPVPARRATGPRSSTNQPSSAGKPASRAAVRSTGARRRAAAVRRCRCARRVPRRRGRDARDPRAGDAEEIAAAVGDRAAGSHLTARRGGAAVSTQFAAAGHEHSAEPAVVAVGGEAPGAVAGVAERGRRGVVGSPAPPRPRSARRRRRRRQRRGGRGRSPRAGRSAAPGRRAPAGAD